MKVAVLTASDRCSRGQAKDESGLAIASFSEAQGWEVVFQRILPDDQAALAAALTHAADELRADLILTTGGTGLGPRDLTPEATLQVIHRPVPGIAEALRSESLKKTAFAMLGRGVAGLRGRSLIINLPGSPGAVRECLAILQPILPHSVDIINGGSH